ANRYFAGHNAKFSADIVWGIDTIDATIFSGSDALTGGAGITGLRADEGDEDGQFAFRTQFQIFF
ncbi:MAG: hypothetical protein O7G85_10730, partial [Planctomycetota bacterium]|nr:hypothetical protein [Planctomycetota bacterium]